MTVGTATNASRMHTSTGRDEHPLSRDASLDLSHEIARHIIAHAEWSGDECSWPTMVAGVKRDRRYGGLALGQRAPTIYHGSAGLSLFLLELSQHVPDAELLRHATGGLQHALRSVPASGWGSNGFFFGFTGVAYVAARAARLLGVRRYAATARRLIGQLPMDISAGMPFDVTIGTAGAILGCLRIADALGDAAHVETAARLSDELIAHATIERVGWSWPCNSARARELSGVAHGTSGIAQAFLEVFAATSDARYAYAAEAAFAYEATTFSAEHGNWMDFRHLPLMPALQLLAGDAHADSRAVAAALDEAGDYAPHCAVGWCHGAAGMTLARLRAHHLLGREQYRDEAALVLPVIKRDVRERTADFTACCGTIGRCETLRAAAAALGDAESSSVVEMASVALGRRVSGLLSGSDADDVTHGDLGMMQGICGLGYYFLRLAAEGVPSLLSFESPAGTFAGAGGSAATAIAAFQRRSHNAHAGRTLRILARFHDACASVIPPLVDAANATLPGTETLHLMEGLSKLAAAEPDDVRRSLMADALAPEQAQFSLFTTRRWHCDELVRHIRRTITPQPNWASVTVQLSKHVQLTRSEYDWDAWLDASPHQPPAPGPSVYFLSDQYQGVVSLTRLDHTTGAVLHHLTRPMCLAELLDASRDALTEASGPGLEEEMVRIALSTAYERGALDVFPIPEARDA
ncbi:MAG: hypothetical protein JWM95_1204 [Gemmatimonadetes bacterium]|nr:hypothetical protein [Gemmatimonadota bacterium]